MDPSNRSMASLNEEEEDEDSKASGMLLLIVVMVTDQDPPPRPGTSWRLSSKQHKNHMESRPPSHRHPSMDQKLSVLQMYCIYIDCCRYNIVV